MSGLTTILCRHTTHLPQKSQPFPQKYLLICLPFISRLPQHTKVPEPLYCDHCKSCQVQRNKFLLSPTKNASSWRVHQKNWCSRSFSFVGLGNNQSVVRAVWCGAHAFGSAFREKLIIWLIFLFEVSIFEVLVISRHFVDFRGVISF